MNKKNKYKRYILILVVILVILGMYVGLCKYNDKKLRKEIHEVVSMNIDSKYKINCKTFFGYCNVEEAIKSYMSDYSIKLNNIKAVSNDEKILNMLTVANYKSDGPKFEKSIKYLQDVLNSYNKDIDSLIEMSDKKYLNNYINKYTKSKKYTKLYKDLIKEEKIYDKLNNTDELKVNKTSVNNTIKVSVALLEFLRDNSKEWKIDGNNIKFNNYKLLNKYNAYLKKLK